MRDGPAETYLFSTSSFGSQLWLARTEGTFTGDSSYKGREGILKSTKPFFYLVFNELGSRSYQPVHLSLWILKVIWLTLANKKHALTKDKISEHSKHN